MNYKKYILVLLVMIAASASAQTLKVVDNAGQPVPYASIISDDGDFIGTTDRAYVTKDELKQKKKENKTKMTYRNLLDFERSHHIPALPEAFQKRINEVIKAK